MQYCNFYFWHSVHSWWDFTCGCFCFGRCTRALVRSRVELLSAIICGIFYYNYAFTTASKFHIGWEYWYVNQYVSSLPGEMVCFHTAFSKQRIQQETCRKLWIFWISAKKADKLYLRTTGESCERVDFMEWRLGNTACGFWQAKKWDQKMRQGGVSFVPSLLQPELTRWHILPAMQATFGIEANVL